MTTCRSRRLKFRSCSIMPVKTQQGTHSLVNLNLKFLKRIRLPIDRQTALCLERFDVVCVGFHVVNLSRTDVGDKESQYGKRTLGCQKLRPLGAPSIAATISPLELWNVSIVHLENFYLNEWTRTVVITITSTRPSSGKDTGNAMKSLCEDKGISIKR